MLEPILKAAHSLNKVAQIPRPYRRMLMVPIYVVFSPLFAK